MGESEAEFTAVMQSLYASVESGWELMKLTKHDSPAAYEYQMRELANAGRKVDFAISWAQRLRRAARGRVFRFAGKHYGSQAFVAAAFSQRVLVQAWAGLLPGQAFSDGESDDPRIHRDMASSRGLLQACNRYLGVKPWGDAEKVWGQKYSPGIAASIASSIAAPNSRLQGVEPGEILEWLDQVHDDATALFLASTALATTPATNPPQAGEDAKWSIALLRHEIGAALTGRTGQGESTKKANRRAVDRAIANGLLIEPVDGTRRFRVLLSTVADPGAQARLTPPQ